MESASLNWFQIYISPTAASLFTICALVSFWRLFVVLTQGHYTWMAKQVVFGISSMMAITSANIIWFEIYFGNQYATSWPQFVRDITEAGLSVCALILVRAWTYERCGERGWITLFCVSVVVGNAFYIILNHLR